jgi:ABC-type multidrug transport system fused ATPase/permease subunit
MAPRSRQILVQMSFVLAAAVIVAVLVFLWKIDAVSAVLFGDPRPLILNGVIILLFILGIILLFKGVRHYGKQEAQISEFMELRAEGYPTEQVLAEFGDPSLLRERHNTIKELFQGGGPVDHGAISSIMLAGESLQLSFPRFVNNVLILTGVFGTVSSLIFALVGATDVLQTAVPGSGMGLLLLGMNTALTTTATAIVCYFFFTFFFHRFTDLQTWVVSRLEKASLLYMVPDFTFEPEAIDHQTKLLVEDVRQLVAQMRQGLSGIEGAVGRIDESTRARHEQGAALISRQDTQNAKLDESLAELAELRRVLAQGFRLDR